MDSTQISKKLAVGHGLFFLASGLWPVFDIRSFEKVTGEKKDDWLVKTVGLLLATTGGAMLATGLRSRKVPPELSALAAGQCAVLGGVSFYYSLRGRISKIYLVDTLMESAWVAAWLAVRSVPPPAPRGQAAARERPSTAWPRGQRRVMGSRQLL